MLFTPSSFGPIPTELTVGSNWEARATVRGILIFIAESLCPRPSFERLASSVDGQEEAYNFRTAKTFMHFRSD
jgi:hypothetical protein